MYNAVDYASDSSYIKYDKVFVILQKLKLHKHLSKLANSNYEMQSTIMCLKLCETENSNHVWFLAPESFDIIHWDKLLFDYKQKLPEPAVIKHV